MHEASSAVAFQGNWRFSATDSLVDFIERYGPADNRALVEIVIEEKPDQGPASGEWEHLPATDKHLEHSKRVPKDAYSGAQGRGISCLLERERSPENKGFRSSVTRVLA